MSSSDVGALQGGANLSADVRSRSELRSDIQFITRQIEDRYEEIKSLEKARENLRERLSRSVRASSPHGEKPPLRRQKTVK